MSTHPQSRGAARLFAYFVVILAIGAGFTACGVDEVTTVAPAQVTPTGLLKVESSEADSDDDGILDDVDPCPADAANDADGDGVCESDDNCPVAPNAIQENIDGDFLGDACDIDNDNDGIDNESDNCSLIANVSQDDVDSDGVGDECDPDADGDAVPNDVDNCPVVSNATQADQDSDGLGDPCDIDHDNDGVENEGDNCPLIPNQSQDDVDNDGVGDACDPDVDGDSVLNAVDVCVNTPLGNPVNAQGCNLVTYAFSGFMPPVDNAPMVNTVKAGSAIPVKFSLGADLGLDIFMTGSPKAVSYTCDGAATDAIEQTVSSTASALTYSAATGQYTYVWKTDKSWGGGCRRLELSLKDGSTQVALFHFSR